MPILGLMSTEATGVDAVRFKNVRRRVFYHYPNGNAPLMGLLSLLKEEETDDPEFSWWEKRLSQQRTTTAIANAAGPWTTNPTTEVENAAETDQAAQTWTVGALRAVTVTVGTVTALRLGHVVRIKNVVMASGPTQDLFGIVTLIDIDGAETKINLRSLTSTGGINVNQATTNNGLEVLVVGSAFSQGALALATGNLSPYNLPVELGNYVQIFRTPFDITNTALKTSVKFDETGLYKDQAKEASISHMIEMEKAFLFGTKAKLNATILAGSAPIAPGNATDTLRTTTGGILHFLARWEAGDYGTVTAAADTDDDKRIIANSTGFITDKLYDGFLERLFRVTNNTANEKLVLCGSGFLSVINQMYKGKACLTADLPLTDTYGMNVVKHVTPFGTIYYKTHPLFSQNALLRSNALFLDVHNLHYRYIAGRDTELLKNRQNNGDDFRRDEWLTECGLELQYPESAMYMQNVLNYSP